MRGIESKGTNVAQYDFTLTFTLPDRSADPADYLDALYEAGCDDATVGVGKRGFIALEFTREAASAEQAVRSAIAAIRAAIPGAELVEVKPDLVNLSDVADMVGCSRQNIRKYAAGEMATVTAPFPAPAFIGSPDLWHLVEIGGWLARNTDLKPRREILEAAAAASVVNLETRKKRIERARRLAL